MTHAHRAGRRLLAATLVTVALAGGTLYMQGDVQPVNDGPNPYQTVLNWAQVPAPRTFGSTAGIVGDYMLPVYSAAKAAVRATVTDGFGTPPVDRRYSCARRCQGGMRHSGRRRVTRTTSVVTRSST